VRRLAPVLLACALLLGACGDDDDAGEPATGGTAAKDAYARVLQRDDLPDVDEVYDDEGSSASKTGCGAMDAEWNVAISDADDPYRSFHLEDGTVVRTAIQSPYYGKDSFDYSWDRLNAMVDECVTRDAGKGSFTRMDDLPQDTLGFVDVIPTSDGPQTTERIYSRVGEREAVVLTVVHTGEGEPPVDVRELLPTALERARG